MNKVFSFILLKFSTYLGLQKFLCVNPKDLSVPLLLNIYLGMCYKWYFFLYFLKDFFFSFLHRETVLVCLGYYKRIQWTRWLVNNRNCYF